MRRFSTLVYIKLLFFIPLCSEIGVTYQLSNGIGLGDHLLGYLHAKWISYKYGATLLYKPFLYSDEFALHEIEELWTEEKEGQFKDIYRGCEESFFAAPLSDNLLHIIPFFSDLEEDQKIHPEWSTFPIDWKNREFRKLLPPLFAPRKGRTPRNTIRNTSDLTIALHIRRGGEEMPFSYAMRVWPMRFASNRYYIDCLRELSRLFPNKILYAHIFTDDPEPKRLADELKAQLKDLPLFFSYREENNCSNTYVIEDFFQMMDFDCLIRSLSNYTLVPALIADYKIVMTPKQGYWSVANREVEYVIDQIELEIDY